MLYKKESQEGHKSQNFHQKKNLGVTGQVLMNSKAIRVPSYATYHTKNGTMRIVGIYYICCNRFAYLSDLRITLLKSDFAKGG